MKVPPSQEDIRNTTVTFRTSLSSKEKYATSDSCSVFGKGWFQEMSVFMQSPLLRLGFDISLLLTEQRLIGKSNESISIHK